MKVKSNKSSDQVVQERKLYTGICNLKVNAINPNVEDLKEIYDSEDVKEPEYFKEDEEGKLLRIEVFVSNKQHNIYTKILFFLRDKIHRNKADDGGNYTNAIGKVCFLKDEKKDNPFDWFDPTGMRPIYQGEDLLLEFIKAWGNVKSGDPCFLENPEKMVKEGDLTELKELLKEIPANEVKCLLGVKDGKYQGVYNRYFEKPYITSINGFDKKLNSGYDDFRNHEYQGSYVLQPYDPTKIVPEETNTAATKEDAPW